MIRIRCKMKGFSEGRALLRSASKRLEKAATPILQKFGDDAVEKLKADAYAGAFKPDKKRGKGPTLVDTTTYIESYHARAEKISVRIDAEGFNEFISNSALAELLEYGYGDVQARPHLRPLGLWIEKEMPERVGKRLAYELFGSA
jgi:hypothetical protein